ncbi:hypothetical protein BDY21DRAFT_280446 [Lineolata rhizophorae]|uniref:Uncharacterized protein n=1 Tax=Lineolata rhizophorae TaxID=578093 RepID=A0A6A6P9W6_9PEZI|nr:hypothetical protein BDY21DRAFT_280446 [Lineolata rhizophorae]
MATRSQPDPHPQPTTPSPAYTPAQLTRYFAHIALPSTHQHHSTASLPPASALSLLARLQRHQLAAVPFENLSLHYSRARRVSLAADDVLDKVLGGPEGDKVAARRGGYCMENNTLFGSVLRALGYSVYAVGGRVNEAEERRWSGWAHTVNLVTIASTTYLVDVGFGPNGPTQPIPLSSTTPSVVGHVAPAQSRVLRKPFYLHAPSPQYLWAYQHRTTPGDDFKDMYVFDEREYFAEDFAVMNLYTSRAADCIFTENVICAKMIMGQEEEGGEGPELAGAKILKNGDFKVRMGERTVRSRTCGTEEERVEVLREEFGIELDEEQKEAIKGTVTELKQ